MKKILILLCFLLALYQTCYAQRDRKSVLSEEVSEVLRPIILEKTHWAMMQVPVTVTATSCERSAGGLHDFYSEGDYWWPNPDDPNGPYIQRDGQTNPENFTAHRQAMIRFSQVVGTLASAYILTGDESYVKHAVTHLKAWFINPETRMNPSLLYAQAIQGRVTGRGIGIIDMIQMMEVAQGVLVMEKAKEFSPEDFHQIQQWFEKYLIWVTTHPYGVSEREALNNHGTCWAMQVAVFARLTRNQALLDYCRERFKKVLLPTQLATDGSFPLETKRTKPYGYSLFNLDAMTTLCHVLSTPAASLWDFTLSDGRTLRKAVDFLYPYVADKAKWPFGEDVMYWDNWPVAHPFLLFAYAKYGRTPWLESWKKLDHNPQTEEVIRNLPIRNPLLWTHVSVVN